MATANTNRLPKFVRLKRALGLPGYAVLGALETLWQHCYATGNPILPDGDAELLVEWDGVEGALQEALITHGWLDELGDGTLAIHDYWDHCPQYVRDRMRKRAKRAKPPDTSADVRDTSADVLDMSGTVRDTSADVRDCPGRSEEKGREEEGTEGKKQPPSPSGTGGARRASAVDPAFLRFWNAYPRKTAVGDAEKAWHKLKPSGGLVQTILDAVAVQKQSRQWAKDNGQFIPHPATWLNRRGWEDEVTPAPGQCGEGSPVPWEE